MSAMETLQNMPIVSQAPNKTKLSSNTTKNTFLNTQDAIKFDWENKWLKGEEYAHILTNLDLYCKAFNLSKLSAKTHPPSIYTEPQNGTVYFVEGNSVGSDFGFPRVDTKKHYRWKKMNFTTDLPKKRPYVTYIVASAVKCERFFPNSKDEGPSYRMHAVILNKERVHTQKYKTKSQSQSLNETDDQNQCLSSTCSSAESIEVEKNDGSSDEIESKPVHNQKEKNYILCHIRKIDSNYKASRNSKKIKEEEEEEEENNEEEVEEEDDDCEESMVKKLFCSKESIHIVKETSKSSQDTEKETPIRLPPLKVPSSDSVNQASSKSEAASPLEKLMPKNLSSPGILKNGLLGIGSKNSAFNSFQSPCITPRFTLLQDRPIQIKVKVEEKKQKVLVEKHASQQKSLFEGFSLVDTTNVDYLQLFSSLINAKK